MVCKCVCGFSGVLFVICKWFLVLVTLRDLFDNDALRKEAVVMLGFFLFIVIDVLIYDRINFMIRKQMTIILKEKKNDIVKLLCSYFVKWVHDSVD